MEQMQRDLRLLPDYGIQCAIDYLCVYLNVVCLVMARVFAETCSH